MPTKPTLVTVTRTQANNAALKDGTVRPDGFELRFEEVPVLVDAFRRMVRTTAFDVCELAFTTYLAARAHGKPFTALPIFLVRGFHHQAMHVNVHVGVRAPKELEGRVVGVNRGYTVTTGVWARGILQDEYDVALDKVTWLRSGDEHVTEVELPSNVTSLPNGEDLEGRLINGQLDAAVGLDAAHPNLAHLIPNPVDAAFVSLRENGLYPINHLIVVKDDVLARHPTVGWSLFEAFAEAKRAYVRRLGDDDPAAASATDALYRRVMTTLGTGDPLPYGIEPNRPMIERLIRHAVEQGILRRAPRVEDLFPKDLHSLTG